MDSCLLFCEGYVHIVSFFLLNSNMELCYLFNSSDIKTIWFMRTTKKILNFKCKFFQDFNWCFINNLLPGFFKWPKLCTMMFDNSNPIESSFGKKFRHLPAGLSAVDQILVIQVVQDQFNSIRKSLTNIFHCKVSILWNVSIFKIVLMLSIYRVIYNWNALLLSWLPMFQQSKQTSDFTVLCIPCSNVKTLSIINSYPSFTLISNLTPP